MLSRKMSAEQLQKVIRSRQKIPLGRTNFGPQEWVKGLQDLGTNCLVIGDWKGRFSFPVFTTVIPLPMERVVPTISSLVEDRIVDWHSPKTAQETLNQTSNRRSPFARAITTMLDRPGEESKEGFRILNEDLGRFRPKPAIFKANDFEKWWFKFALGITAQGFIKARATFDHGEISPEARNLLETVEKQMEIFTGTLRSLSPRDLSSYLRFADLYAQLGKIMGLGHFQSFNGKLDALGKLIIPKLEETEREEIALRKGLHEEDLATWARLKVGWNWEQVQDALATLPTLGSQLVIAHTLAALHLNLKELDTREEVNGRIELSPAGFTFLLGFNPETVIKETRAQERYPAFVKEFEETVELPYFSAPIRYAPLTAITLLKKASETYSEDGFKQLLTATHGLVQTDKNLTNPWLLTLLSLKNNHPQIVEFINNLLVRWENLPQEVREIILNEAPGKLSLTRQGQLRVRSKSAVPTAHPAEACPNPSMIEVADRATEVEKVLILPFLGEVGLVGKGEVKTLLITPNGIPANEDKLLNDFASLAGHWKDTFRRERHLLYFPQLNSSNLPLQEARRLFGITAVYIKRDEFIFVLDKEKLSAQVDGRSLPVGFQGKLDETGQLHILGMDSSFLGESEQLILKNLALRLTTQSFYDWGVDQERDRGVRRLAHGIIADWNRFQRKSLPKIDLPFGKTSQNGLCLPVAFSDEEKPALACEY